jgi:hypothetical protein
MEEYRRLNSEERGTFQSWLLANTVIGALAFFSLIAAIALVHSDHGAATATAQEKIVTLDGAP